MFEINVIVWIRVKNWLLFILLTGVGSVGLGANQVWPAKQTIVKGVTLNCQSEDIKQVDLFIAPISHTLRKVQSVSEELMLPSRVVIKLTSDSDVTEGADATGYITYDPKWFAQVKPTDPEPILTHEIGHLLFFETANLKLILPPNHAYITYIEDQRRLRSLFELAEIKRDKEELLRLRRESSGIRFMNEEEPFNALHKPYAEFFSDFLSVIITEDPNVMASREVDISRTFDPLASKGDNYESQIDPHVYFFEGRQYLWAYWQNHKTVISKSWLVKTVYTILVNEVFVRSQDAHLQSLSKKDIDSRLLAEIEKKLPN